MHQETTAAEINAPTFPFNPVSADSFRSVIGSLHARFNAYVASCPAPYVAAGVVVTPEIRCQCECYLPVSEITTAFYKLYRAALSYPPILSSTPFYNALSWVDTFAQLPIEFQFSANPALLLERLLEVDQLLERFLFASFLPDRFYGGIRRYPRQKQYIREWLASRVGRTICCIDVACGIGEEVFGLGLMLAEQGFPAEDIKIHGWTLEPLEVWAATYRRLPHNRKREQMVRDATEPIFSHGFGSNISFKCQNILKLSIPEQQTGRQGFHLILCNGLLGGPIINEPQDLKRIVEHLAKMLAPGGILLVADAFHGGWKQQCPQTDLWALLERSGLTSFKAGEGIGGSKSDQ